MMNDDTLENWQDFFSRYKSHKQNLCRVRIEEFKYGFSFLQSAFITIQRLIFEIDRMSAYKFNLFRLFNIDRQEVKTHSALIADLLSPVGLHSQGSLFLNNFLKLIQNQIDLPIQLSFDQIPFLKWYVETEKVTEFGNLDIVLSNFDERVLIVIENKIDAVEQPNQLMRYVQWMDTMRNFYDFQVLIFLTPYGTPSQTAKGNKYLKISYNRDIVNWLKSSLNDIRTSRVKEVIIQYIEIAESI